MEAMPVSEFSDYKNQLIASRKPLSEYINLRKRKYIHVPEGKGLYTFWYDNHDGAIESLTRGFTLTGPNGSIQKVEWNWNTNDEFVCLYVGKTTNLKKRLGNHLKLKSTDLCLTGTNTLLKMNGSGQLRSGLDYLHSETTVTDIIEVLESRIWLSLCTESNFITRFYAEDYLIGTLKPWFNIDSER
jgi:hypothetical protein